MNATAIAAATLRALRADVTGETLLRGDVGYDRARAVYNAVHDRWPALIARAADAADVARIVRFAADEGLMLAVRGGNHSMRGYGSCDDGVVLDLHALRSVHVDPIARTARVGGGATWADVNAAAHRHGLATTGGLISTTGVGGLTLGGGVGYLTRRLGLACDNLIAAEVVTARGDIVHADARNEPDLFRAIRGGGGNFGVVTSFTFRLAPVAHVLGGPIVFAADDGVLRGYDAFMAAAPRELGVVLGLTLAPPLPFLDAADHLKPAAVMIVCWSGDEADGDGVIDGLRALGTVKGEHVGTMPYPVVNTLFDDLLPAGLRHYWKSRFFGDLPAEAVGPMVERGRTTPNIESGIFFYPVDGAAANVPAETTAWAHRDARYLVGFHGSWRDRVDDATLRDWVEGAYATCGAGALPGAYVNFASDDAPAAPDDYGTRLNGLVAAKRRYDPHNLFCLNANIDPDAAHAR
jgi:FAD/FMN-containing dehydrogenase